jgi:Rrf2 family iron-sulfur cluster assembly transcriptional regulator
MLSFSHTTGYAILALGCVESGNGHWVLSQQIHKCTGIPMPYLRKVLNALGQAGLIRTKRGYRGGFVLARPATEITLTDVVEAMERENPIPDCLLGLPGCSDATPCPLRSFWREERAKIERQLRDVTVAEAAECVRTARWGKLCRPAKASSAAAKCGKARPSRRKRR